MNIALVYSSNSGGTFLAGEIVRNILSKKHSVVMKKAEEVSAKKITEYDLVVFGSPTWSVDGKDGMPLEFMLNLFKNIEATGFAPKKYAIYGCGNSSFTRFCAAVDLMDEKLKALNSTSIINPLKIDGYFFKEKENNQLVSKWANELLKVISKN